MDYDEYMEIKNQIIKELKDEQEKERRKEVRENMYCIVESQEHFGEAQYCIGEFVSEGGTVRVSSEWMTKRADVQNLRDKLVEFGLDRKHYTQEELALLNF